MDGTSLSVAKFQELGEVLFLFSEFIVRYSYYHLRQMGWAKVCVL